MKRFILSFATLLLVLMTALAPVRAQSVSIAAVLMNEDLEVIRPEATATEAWTVQFSFPELSKPLPAIVYPVRAKKFNIQGRVLVEYTVNEKGRAEDIEILRGPSAGCKKEVKRVLRAARFKPVLDEDGNPVATRFLSGFDFRLK